MEITSETFEHTTADRYAEAFDHTYSSQVIACAVGLIKILTHSLDRAEFVLIHVCS